VKPRAVKISYQKPSGDKEASETPEPEQGPGDAVEELTDVDRPSN
jgi:hypothetical protein